MYFLNLLFTFKVGTFMMFAGLFIFLNAVFPFVPVPKKINLHSVINQAGFWFSELEQCRRKNEKS